MVIVVDEVTKEWVVQVQKVYYCKKDHEPVAVTDQPDCPVCGETMEEMGWMETNETLQSVQPG